MIVHEGGLGHKRASLEGKMSSVLYTCSFEEIYAISKWMYPISFKLFCQMRY